MKVYKFRSNRTNCKHICPIGKDVWESIGQPEWFGKYENRLWLSGEPMYDIWCPFEFEICKHTADFPLNDCSYASFYPPILNQKSVNALQDIFSECTELLEINLVDLNTIRFFILHAICIADVLDMEGSQMEGSNPNNYTYAFLPERISSMGLKIFKIPQIPYIGWDFVTDVFVERVNTSQLSGFHFTKVWSSETH